MASAPDTIAAIATPPGRGAIGVLRVSGPASVAIAQGVLGRLPRPRQAALADFCDADGGILDRGLALYFPAPHSFTGEDVLELHAHGGVQVLDLLLRRLLALGCRQARAGEFSERAFLNGKLDIAQAEAIADLIDAGSAAAARAAVRSMRGEFSTQVRLLQAKLTGLRILAEAAIDFPDEEVDFAADSVVRSHLAGIISSFEQISATARQGALLREGLNVVIAGPPNAGKSSLLNRLAGDDVAIVADLPGTTRDVLREHLNLDGLPINIIDTAGLRHSEDRIELEGIRRARSEIARADLVLYVIDDTTADDALTATNAMFDIAPAVPVTVVFNKIDLSGASPALEQRVNFTQIRVSVSSGAGIDLLRAHLKRTAGVTDGEGAVVSARRRHLDALARARRAVDAAAVALNGSGAPELVAEDLRLAQRALGEITGEFSSDDLLGAIFSSFCIGK